jgi:hypothetical protein
MQDSERVVLELVLLRHRYSSDLISQDISTISKAFTESELKQEARSVYAYEFCLNCDRIAVIVLDSKG